MDDLILRAAAIEAFDDERVDRNYGDVSPESVIGVIESIPAVDAVPVIRCRYCKHSIENAKHIDVACERSYDPDFYCAAGERKESE